jgi:hypothetical protein
MYLLNQQALIVALGGLLLISPCKGIGAEGYKGITRYENDFVAAGSEGRIDRISQSGKLIRSDKFPGEIFNCIASDNKMIVAAGDNGIILISPDGKGFRKIESNTDNDINSVAIFNNTIIAGADHGEIVLGDVQGRFRNTRPGIKGNVVSVSAGRADCYGVTDEGEIIHSRDGINWEIFDLNQVYKGFYQPGHFTKILVTGDRIAVTGFRDDGSPFLMFSSQGKVWTERVLNYIDDNEIQCTLSDLPNDIMYDEADDQFFIAFNDGKLMELSSCPHCNKLTVISGEDLTGLSSDENILMIVGSNFFIKALKIR